MKNSTSAKLLYLAVFVFTSGNNRNLLRAENLTRDRKLLMPNENKRIGEVSRSLLPIPPGYKKFEVPQLNPSLPVLVFVSLYILEVKNVNTKDEIIELDTHWIIQWNDWKIWEHLTNQSDGKLLKKCSVQKDENGECVEHIRLDPDNLKRIWSPDLIIDELESVSRPSLISEPTTLLIFTRPVPSGKTHPGHVEILMRLSMKLNCDMEFQYYPADIQRCSFTLRTFDSLRSEVLVSWKEAKLDTISNPNFQFQLTNVEPGNELGDFLVQTEQEFPALTFTLEIKRNINYHLVQTYLPSILLVLVTLLCFLLPSKMVEGRIGVCMTTLLTMTAMFTGVREQAPEVSYVTAMDIWMFFSTLLIFLALVLFFAIHWLQMKLKKFWEKKLNPNPEDPTELECHPTEKEIQPYRNIVRILTRYAFLGFVTAFLLFLLTYSTCILVFSGYYDWDPSPKYNALEEEDQYYRKIPFHPVAGSVSQRQKVLKELDELWNINRIKYSLNDSVDSNKTNG